MKRWIFIATLIVTVWLAGGVHAEQHQKVETVNNEQHNWVEYSVDFHEVDGGSHEYTYWKNFIKRNRTCLKTHVIKTVVYYCDEHDHVKTETYLHETKHSHKHGK